MDSLNIALPFTFAVCIALFGLRDNPKVLITIIALYCGIAFGMAFSALLIARNLDKTYVNNILEYSIFLSVSIIATGFACKAFSNTSEYDERL